MCEAVQEGNKFCRLVDTCALSSFERDLSPGTGNHPQKPRAMNMSASASMSISMSASMSMHTHCCYCCANFEVVDGSSYVPAYCLMWILIELKLMLMVDG